ncbi:hypothetical protein ACJ73_04300, partial [Blastomyces percursus]
MGYAIVNYRTTPKESRYLLACDRSGPYKTPHGIAFENRQRVLTSTRKTDFPFRLNAKKGYDEWIITVKDSSHNHPLSLDSRAHPMHRLRSLSEGICYMIRDLVKSAVPPCSIRTVLNKRFQRVPLTARDIYNINAELLRGELKGRTPTQALIDELTSQKDQHIIADWKKDDENRITHLALFRKQSIEYLRDNHDILLLDCTYKTNRYRLPLQSIIFVTKLHTTTNMGFIFMNGEKEFDYRTTTQLLKMSTRQKHQASNQEGKLLLAIQALSQGQISSVRAAAKLYSVPQSTLVHRVSGRTARVNTPSKQRKLSPTEEESLVQWILVMDERGHPPRVGSVREMANILLANRDPSAEAKPPPTVGKSW